MFGVVVVVVVCRGGWLQHVWNKFRGRVDQWKKNNSFDRVVYQTWAGTSMIQPYSSHFDTDRVVGVSNFLKDLG